MGSFRFLIGIISIFVLIFFSFAASAFAQEKTDNWIYSGKNNNGFRELSTYRNFKILGHDCTAKISFGFNCTPDPSPRGSHSGMVIDVKILNHKSVPEFHFDDFEGPDPETDRIVSNDLMTLKLENNNKTIRYSCIPNGWQSEGGFSFGFGEFNENLKVVNEIIAGAKSMVIAISDSRNPKIRIVIPILFSGNHDIFLFKALTDGLH